MKKTLILIAFFLFNMVLIAQNDHKTDVKNFQTDMNLFYSDSVKSPLTKKDLENFEALDFFPIDENFRVEAKFKKAFNPVTVYLKTSTDRMPEYRVYATVEFNLNGKSHALNVYQNVKYSKKEDYKDDLFLPFTDNSNGHTSYTGGRYVDLKIPEGDLIVIDFNRAYNPYCAYNHKYSCVVPPAENHIDEKVNAGVKYVKHK